MALLGEQLITAGLAKASDVEAALQVQRAQGGRLGDILSASALCRYRRFTPRWLSNWAAVAGAGPGA